MKKLTLLLMALFMLIACESENETETERVDMVNKLLNKTQIENYVMKFSDELQINKTIEQIDALISDNDSKYTPDIGERTSEEITTEYEFFKQNNEHYIKVDVIYVVTFTHSRFNGITHVVIHRPIEYDIGKVYIRLDVDYNEDGYLLKGRKIVEGVE